jgi:hypothetical protein
VEPEWWATVPPNLSSVQRGCGGDDKGVADIEDLAPKKTKEVAIAEEKDTEVVVLASEAEAAAVKTDMNISSSSSTSSSSGSNDSSLLSLLVRAIRSKGFSLVVLMALALLLRRRLR